MRYTLTDRAIAVLLSVILFMGSAAMLFEPAEFENESFIIESSDETEDAANNPQKDDTEIINESFDDADEDSDDKLIYEDEDNEEDIINDFEKDINTNQDTERSESSDINVYDEDDDTDDSNNEDICDFGCEDDCEYNCIESLDFELEIVPYSETYEVTFFVTNFDGVGDGDLTAQTDLWNATAFDDSPVVREVLSGTVVTFTAFPNIAGHNIHEWIITPTHILSGTEYDRVREVTVTGDITVIVVFERVNALLEFFIDTNTSDSGSGTISMPSPINPPGSTAFNSEGSGIYQKFENDRIPTGRSFEFTASPTVVSPPGISYLVGKWEINTSNDGINWSGWNLVQTGRNSYISNYRTGATQVRVSFLEGRSVGVTAFLGNSGETVGGTTGTYSLGGESLAVDFDAQGLGVVPTGSSVTLTAPTPPAGFNFYGVYEWTIDGVPQSEQGRTITRTISNNSIITVTLIESFEVNYSINVDDDYNDGEISAVTKFIRPNGETVTGTVNPGGRVREGTSITFAVTKTPAGYHVYEYIWDINGEVSPVKQLHSEPGAGILPDITVNKDVSVTVYLERGHMVSFDLAEPSSGGNVTGTATDGANEYTLTRGNDPQMQRAGSLIAFTAERPSWMDAVFAHRWMNLLLDESSRILPETSAVLEYGSLNEDIDITVGFMQGHKVTLLVAEGEGQLTTEYKLNIYTAEPDKKAEMLVEENDPPTVIIFEAKADDPVDNVVYRFSHWTYQTGTQIGTEVWIRNDASNELSLPISDETAVRAHFERVIFTLDDDAVEVTGHNEEYVIPSVINVSDDSNAAGNISFEYYKDGEGIISTLPDGLSISINGNTSIAGAAISLIITSELPLSRIDNGIYIVTVKREGVTATFEIDVRLPFMYIEDTAGKRIDYPYNSDDIISITNSYPTGTVVLYTNAPAGDPPNYGISFEIPDNLPAGLKNILENDVFSYHYSEPEADAIDGDRVTIIINADRLSLVNPVNITIPVRVHRGGVSSVFRLYINLIPPARIDSITFNQNATEPSFDFQNVSVHGTPPGASGTAPGAVVAVFDISGDFFSGDNEKSVSDAIVLENLPAGVISDTSHQLYPFKVTIENNTRAYIEVPLIIEANKYEDGNLTRQNRSGEVEFSIDTDILPNPENRPDNLDHSYIKGILDIFQYGPITLEPDEVEITNLNRSDSVTVGGSGDIDYEVTSDPEGAYPDIISIEIINNNDDDIIQIFSNLPDRDIKDKLIMTVSRDGLSETLTINYDLTAKNVPVIFWPGKMEAVFGDLLATVMIKELEPRDYMPQPVPLPSDLPTGVGFAFFPDDLTSGFKRVEGTFKWDDERETVGDAGKPGPNPRSMTFTPDDEDFASVTRNINIDVNKADPVVNWDNITASLTYGEMLSEAVFTGATATFGGNSVNGSFNFEDDDSIKPEVKDSGKYMLIFTPAGDDANNFNEVSGYVEVNIGMAQQVAPDMPDDYSTTAVSITLNNIPDAEFIVRTTNTKPTSDAEWNNAIKTPENLTTITFEDLIPFTTYYIFMRLPGNDNQYPSPSSEAAGSTTGEGITTDKAELKGTLRIDGDAVYLETLEINAGGLFADPPGTFEALRGLSFVWYREGETESVKTGTTYDLGADDIGKIITVFVTAQNTEDPIPALFAEIGPVLRKSPGSDDLSSDITAQRTFNRSPQSVTVNEAQGVNGLGAITKIEYRLYDDNTGLWSENEPINAGYYIVRVYLAEGDNYFATPDDKPIILDGQLFIDKAAPAVTDLNITWDRVVQGGSVDWIPGFLINPPGADVEWKYDEAELIEQLGKISIFYRLEDDNKDQRTENRPISTGTYLVTVDIASGDNYTAASDITIGVFTITGSDIDPADITVNGINSLIFHGVDEVYTGSDHPVDVKDIKYINSTISYRIGTDGQWNTGIPQFKNVTQGAVTVYFRVERPNPEYNVFEGSTTVIITPLQLTWNPGTVSNKPYDGGNSAVISSEPSLSGILIGDSVSVTKGTVIFNEINAGENITTTASGWGISGNLNYAAPAVQPSFGTADITKVVLTPVIDFNDVVGKVYDRTTNIVGIQPTIILRGSVNGEEPEAGATFRFVDANVGVNKDVITEDIALSGSWGDNYELSTDKLTQASGVDITRAMLTPSMDFTGVADKVYDRTTAVLGTQPVITFSGAIPGDIPEATAIFVFVNANVGENKDIVASNITLTEAWRNNYSLSTTTLTQASGADITPLQLTWSPGTVSSRPYNGSAGASIVQQPSLIGIITGDTVSTVQGTVVFDNANAGNRSTIADGWGISGNTNYAAPAAQPGFGTANITKVTLTPVIDFTNVIGKVYDRTTDIVGDQPIIMLSGAVNGEDPEADATFEFVNANAGVNKNVITENIALSGAWGTNYVLSTDELTQASGVDITPKLLYWETGSASNPATVIDRDYDGTTVALPNNKPTIDTSDGVITGDEVTVREGDVNFATAFADTENQKVTATGWGLEGKDAGNYYIYPEQPIFADARISRLDLSNIPSDDINVVIEGEYTFTGEPVVPQTSAVIVNITDIGKLVYGSDFIFDVSNNINSGNTAKVTVTGVNNFVGDFEVLFTILPQAISGYVYIKVDEATLGVGGQITEETVLRVDLSSVTGVPNSSVSVSESDFEYQWFKDGTELPGATYSYYKVTNQDDADAEISLKISGKGSIILGEGNYSGDLYSVHPITVGKIPITGKFVIDGNPVLGEVLKIEWDENQPLTPADADVIIRWLRDGEVTSTVNIEYTVTREDLGTVITAEVIGTGDYTGSLGAYIVIPAIEPLEVLGLTAESGDRNVVLRWRAPEFDGGSDIIKYEVSYNGGTGWVSAGLITEYTFMGLVNDRAYDFRVRAVNGVGAGEYVEVTAVPVAPPVIISITPSAETDALFTNISDTGFTGDAVFNVFGTNLTENTILSADVFGIVQFPGWIMPNNLRVEFIDKSNARVTVTLAVRSNTDEARSDVIVLGNLITEYVSGVLDISQIAFVPPPEPEIFRVTILNSPAGSSIPVGQSENVREYGVGETVSLVAGTRIGYEFGFWSSSAFEFVISGTSESVTSFQMPDFDVVITANWTPLPGEPPAEPGAGGDPPAGNTPGGAGGTGPGGPGDGAGDEAGIDGEAADGDEQNGEAVLNEGSDTDHEEGNGSGGLPDSGGMNAGNVSEGQGTEIDQDIADELTPTHEVERQSFIQWLINNPWWIILYIIAIIVFTILWFADLRKRKHENDRVARPAST